MPGTELLRPSLVELTICARKGHEATARRSRGATGNFIFGVAGTVKDANDKFLGAICGSATATLADFKINWRRENKFMVLLLVSCLTIAGIFPVSRPRKSFLPLRAKFANPRIRHLRLKNLIDFPLC